MGFPSGLMTDTVFPGKIIREMPVGYVFTAVKGTLKFWYALRIYFSRL